jgi:hypothetical protein
VRCAVIEQVVCSPSIKGINCHIPFMRSSSLIGCEYDCLFEMASIICGPTKSLPGFLIQRNSLSNRSSPVRRKHSDVNYRAFFRSCLCLCARQAAGSEADSIPSGGILFTGFSIGAARSVAPIERRSLSNFHFAFFWCCDSFPSYQDSRV